MTASAGWAAVGSFAYGDHSDQVVEVGSDGITGPVLALLHGGYWRPRHGRQLMWPMARDFDERGWTVANVEYRRGSGWWETVADASAALAALRQLHPLRPLILIGHSAGGHLALLAASSADAVLALAPVTDLARGYEEGIGEGAVHEFLGVTPTQDPDAYVRATPSPADLHTPTMIVHGPSDDRVPITHTDAFVHAMPAGARSLYLRPPGVGHLDLIDPATDFWTQARAWLDLAHRGVQEV